MVALHRPMLSPMGGIRGSSEGHETYPEAQGSVAQEYHLPRQIPHSIYSMVLAVPVEHPLSQQLSRAVRAELLEVAEEVEVQPKTAARLARAGQAAQAS